MSKSKFRFDYLPLIDSKYDSQNPSTISKFSNELQTASFRRQNENHKSKTKKRLHKAIKQARNEQDLKDCKNNLEKLKEMIQKNKQERVSWLQDRLQKIQKLSHNNVSKSLEAPRSSIGSNHSPYIVPTNFNPYPMAPVLPPYHSPIPMFYSQNDIDNRSFYKKKKKKYRNLFTEEQEKEDYSKKRYISHNDTSQNIKQMPRPNASNIFKKKLNKKKLKKWKVIVWAVSFSIWLAKFSKNIMAKRLSNFEKFQNRNFNIQMVLFQKYIVNKFKPFFIYLLNRKQISFTLQNSQTRLLEKEKTLAIKRLINMLIQGIMLITFKEKNDPGIGPSQILHMFCKHGAFVGKDLMTKQQLEIISFSQKYGYMRMDKALEKSQIISFLLIKILLYNSILQPEKINKEKFNNDKNLKANMHFLGSIWYQICMDIQDQLLCTVPVDHYELGNWKKIKVKGKINPSQSLCVKGSPLLPEELVSGLIHKKKLDNIFGVNFWKKQKLNLNKAVDHLHEIIVKYHNQLKESIKF